ncbi:MAG: electron transfer flavoprotein subunit alpha/FixB family protein [Myxococcales bacterium]|nr:electron transfer flavoprotein subunit alpha/FixB family protein [Myxococcales bacterium]
MGNILVVTDHVDGALSKPSFPTVTFAQQVKALEGGEIIGLVLGSGAKGVADQLAQAGVDKVIYVDDASFANPVAESYAAMAVEVAKEVNASIVCAPANIFGKDYMPRVAYQLEAGMVTDVIDASKDGDQLQFKRPMWAGNIIAKMAIETPVKVVTVRHTAYDAPQPGSASVDERSASKPAEGTTFVAFEQVKSERPALTDANVVVSGGRGLGSAEAFGMLESLADVLGAAMGASRAACDSGMAPHDWQVGQTGKVVAPDLYFAVAISGAIQHLAGMKGSKTIVAINTNPEAPIFQVADYGLVADAFDVVPQLTEKLAAVKNG